MKKWKARPEGRFLTLSEHTRINDIRLSEHKREFADDVEATNIGALINAGDFRGMAEAVTRGRVV